MRAIKTLQIKDLVKAEFMTLDLRPEDLEVLSNGQREIAADNAVRTGSYSIYDGGKLLMCCGVVPYYVGAGEAWIYCDKAVVDYPIEIYRVSLHILDQLTKENKYWRVQARCQADWFEANKFLEHLGFQFEAFMPYHGPNMKNYNLYARLREWA